MRNNASQSFVRSGTFTPPAGCTQVTVVTQKKANPIPPGSAGALLDPLGNLYTWGPNTLGQLGQGDVTARSIPTVVPNILWSKVLLNSGNSGPGNAMGIAKTTGQVYTWGNNGDGQLGQGGTTALSTPTLVSGTLTGTIAAMDIYLGGDTQASPSNDLGRSGFIISTQGVLYATGKNANGQLGCGDVTARNVFAIVGSGLPSGGGLWSKITGGVDTSSNNHYTLGLSSNGQLYSWGSNTDGQLGVGDVTARSTPTLVLGGLTFASVHAAANAVFAITTAGVMYAWGCNINGGLGLGDVVPRSSPVAVLGGLTFSSVVPVESGINSRTANAYAIGTSGQLYAWGYNAFGELGVGDVVSRSSPVAVLGLNSVKQVVPTIIFGTGGSAFALTTGGIAYAWGNNTFGQLGVGDSIPRSSPVAVLGGLVFNQLSSTYTVGQVVYGIDQNGTLYSWGSNVSGELGNNTTTSTSSPVRVVSPIPVAGFQDAFTATPVAVTPGTSYAVTLGQAIAQFGGIPLGGPANPDAVTVYYQN